MENKNYCIIHPKTSSNQLSKLFSDLRKEFSYEQSWELWNAAVSNEYKDKFGLTTEYDEYGEPTLESLLSNLNIVSDNIGAIEKYEKELNLNIPVENKAIIQRVIDFNKNHQAVKAKIESFNLEDSNENTAKIIVEPCSEIVREQARALETNAAIYSKINTYLNKLGYSIDFFSSKYFNNEVALLDPSSGIVNSKGLLNVIKLSNNQEALEHLPEELGHFLIECSKDKSSVTRAVNILNNNPELIEEILKDEYSDIVYYYTGINKPELITMEALGRFLIDSINDNIDSIIESQDKFTIDSLISKVKNIWNGIKNIFKINTKTKQDAYNELRQTIDPILHTFSVNDTNKNKIKERFKEYGNQMAHVNTVLQNYKELFSSGGVIDEIRNTIARETDYYSKTYRDVISLKEELEVTREAARFFIKTREKSIKKEPKNYNTEEVADALESKGDIDEQQILDIRNLYHFGNYIEKVQELIRSQLKMLAETQLSSSTYEDVLKRSREINTIRSFVETQEPIMRDLLNFSIAISTSPDSLISNTMKAVAEELKNLAFGATSSIAALHSELHSTVNIITEEFWKNSTDPEVLDNIIPKYIQSKENLVDNSKKIGYILNFLINDISGVSRLFTSYYAQKDPLINLVNNTLRKQEESARIASQIFNKEITEIAQDYINKTGSSDFSFIHEKDSKGNPTHFLITLEGVSISKWREAKARVFKAIEDDDSLTNKQKYERKKAFLNNSTDKKELINFKYDPSTNSFISTQDKVSIRIPTSNTNQFPEATEWITNDFSKLNSAQQEFLVEYLKSKNKLESMLPSSVRCKNEGIYYRAVQRVVASAGEAILNNKTGLFYQLGGALANSTYKLDEDDITDSDIDEDSLNYNTDEDTFLKAITKRGKKFKNKVLRSIHRWLYPDYDPKFETPDPDNPLDDSGIIKKRTSSEFNERRKVPVYFTRLLSPDRLSSLSTDAIGSLIEYSMACFRFNAMNEVADIMELTYERAKYRRIQKTKFSKKYLLNLSDPSNPENVLNQPSTISSADSNMLKSLRQLLDTKLYSEYNMDARGTAGSISPAKMTNTFLKMTAFSMLGYNIFSGINNIVVGKYQTMIEAIGKSNFDKKDWAWAEKEYHKLLLEYIAELGKPYKTSKLALLDELFNATMEWKETLEGAKYYSNDALRTLSKFNSGVLMNIGETNLKLVTLLAKLHNYKMKDSEGNETNLYESLQFDYKYNKNGDKISGKISIKNGYTKPDGTKFTMTRKNGYQQSDLYDFCLKMNVMNHRMHGIYNREDQIEALRHWWGKLLLLFRRFIVPTVENRYMGSRYNVDTKQWEEGFYVTGLKAITKIIMNEAGLAYGQGRIKGALNDFNDFQKANLKKFIGEFSTLITLMLLIAFAVPDYKDEDRFVLRAVNYHIRRLIQEIEFYQPWNINSIYDILQSPSATLGLLTRYFEVLGSVPNLNERYKAGPNKGKLKIGVKAMNALPLYPQIRDVIKFAEDDGRFRIFEPVMFESLKNEE